MNAIGFNPRPRAGGDTHEATIVRERASFNPRPRAGGDPIVAARYSCTQVSIHAPVRGATTRSGRPS